MICQLILMEKLITVNDVDLNEVRWQLMLIEIGGLVKLELNTHD